MTEAATAATLSPEGPPSGQGIVLKCFSCRTALPGIKEKLGSQAKKTDLMVIQSDKDDQEDDLPNWIQDLVEKSGWTKGRIPCPKCSSRIGGFDLVGGLKNPVYLVRSKIDVHEPIVNNLVEAQIVQKRHADEGLGLSEAGQQNPQPEAVDRQDEIASNPLSSFSPSSSSSLTSKNKPPSMSGSSISKTNLDPADPLECSSGDILASTSTQSTSCAGSSSSPLTTSSSCSSSSSPPSQIKSSRTATAEASTATADDERARRTRLSSSSSSSSTSSSSSSSSGEESELLPSKAAARKKKKKSKIRNRRRKMRDQRIRRAMKREKSWEDEDRKEKLKKMILSSEPELDLIPDHLLCAVCLDLLHDPFVTKPCSHVFCETCLRRLGMKGAMNTSCPLCRARIVLCLPERDLSLEIRETYVDMYAKRKKIERSSNVYDFPLPWRPGWRSLMAGRPLGGNRFPNESVIQFLLRLLTQVPHYIPPVVLANLINLILLIIILGTFEIAPIFMKINNPARFPGEQMTVPTSAAPRSVGGDAVLGNQMGQLTGGQMDQNGGKLQEFAQIISDIIQKKQMSERCRNHFSFANDDDIVDHNPPSASVIDGNNVPFWFYFAMATSTVVVAILSNCVLALELTNPVAALAVDDDPLLNHWTFGVLFHRLARIRRFSNLEFCLVLCAAALVFLPLVVPASRLANASSSSPQLTSPGIDVTPTTPSMQPETGDQMEVRSYLALAAMLAVGGIYWVGIFVMEREIGEDFD